MVRNIEDGKKKRIFLDISWSSLEAEVAHNLGYRRDMVTEIRKGFLLMVIWSWLGLFTIWTRAEKMRLFHFSTFWAGVKASITPFKL